MDQPSLCLNNVLVVPQLHANLLSISGACADGTIDRAVFEKDTCTLWKKGELVGSGTRQYRLYLIETRQTKPEKALVSIDTWHRRLCQADTHTINAMKTDNDISGLLIDKQDQENRDTCQECVLSKKTHQPFPKEQASPRKLRASPCTPTYAAHRRPQYPGLQILHGGYRRRKPLHHHILPEKEVRGHRGAPEFHQDGRGANPDKDSDNQSRQRRRIHIEPRKTDALRDGDPAAHVRPVHTPAERGSQAKEQNTGGKIQSHYVPGRLTDHVLAVRRRRRYPRLQPPSHKSQQQRNTPFPLQQGEDKTGPH